MKNLFFVSVAFSIISGTSFTASAQTPKFIEGISFTATPVAAISTPQPQADQLIPLKKVLVIRPAVLSGAIELCSRLQFKFAQLMNRNVESLTNISLFAFIDDWWETRYRYGGTTRAGIDCSAFVGLLMGTVYGLKMPRTARELYSASDKVSKEQMHEGDMVFFNTRGGISHVGLYLGEGYFVHASVSNGVTISNLNEGYYARKFIGARRVSDVDGILVKAN